MKKDKVSLTCYDFHMTNDKLCNKQSCKMWINAPMCQNCTVISAKTGPKTLQEIGDIFGVTRMRICQIEKIVLNKLHRSLSEYNITK